MSILRAAMLHLDPRPGALEGNRALIERSVRLAAARGAKFILTPELVESGYHFPEYIGTGWIGQDSRNWLEAMTRLAIELNVTIFLSTAERDEASGELFNTVFALASDGRIAGKYRKINIHSSHTAESWADTGDRADVIVLSEFKIGILICADAWHSGIAAELAAKGADLIISAANWGETPCPPESCWERRSAETGVPVWNCNRTGAEHDLNFEDAASVVAVNGKRLLQHAGPGSAVLLFDWDIKNKRPLQTAFEVVFIP